MSLLGLYLLGNDWIVADVFTGVVFAGAVCIAGR